MMRAIVLNLPRREDRLDKFMVRWVEWGLPYNLQVWPAVDGPELYPDEPVDGGGRAMAGVRGCYESHQQIMSSSDDELLVFEDDCLFTNLRAFKESFESIPADWQVLRWTPVATISPVLGWQVGTATRTTVYAVKGKVLAKLIPPYVGETLDTTMQRVGRKHGLKQYTFFPKLVYQDLELGTDIGSFPDSPHV